MNKKRLWKKSLTLRSKLVWAFVMILLLPSLSIGAISYDTARAKVQEEMFASASGKLAVLNETINQMIGATEKNVDFLADQLPAGNIGPVQGNEDPFVRAVLDAYKQKHDDVELASVGTDQGVYVNAPKSAVNPADYDPRKRPWYISASENKGKPTIISPYISSNTGNVVVSVAQTTKDGHGVVSVSLSLKALSDLVNSTKIGTKGYVYVLDKSNKFIVHPHEKSGSEATASPYPDIFEQKQGSLAYSSTDGSKQHAFITTNEKTGWVLVGVIDDSEVSAAAQPIWYKTLIVVAIAFAVSALIITYMIRSITRPLKQLVAASEEISHGNLTLELTDISNDELGQLSSSFNRMTQALHAVIGDVNSTAMQLAESSEQLSTNASETSKASEQVALITEESATGIEKQAASLQHTAQQIKELSDGVHLITASTQQVSTSAQQATGLVRTGTAKIQSAVTNMIDVSNYVQNFAGTAQRLGDHSVAIGQFVSTITGLATQTNLLALNAAIEAARAGEHGRGFAIVASEVRKLAEQSGDSAKHIAELVQAIRQEIDEVIVSVNTGVAKMDDGIRSVQTADEAFLSINAAIDDLTSQVEGIAFASEQMSASTAEVVQAIQFVSEVSERNAAGTESISASTEEQVASIEEIASSAEELAHLAQNLQTLVVRFKI
ncbi:methyl-accepting chemotaxis protein [Paenibacillus sp. FSL H8-0537]|uniref:methyl-accepting chemotaxis protein n=1 Tax=Paenibacillus sp. FSL H8-0537 TaxID=2921399 RepID=UPI003100C7E1